MSRSEHVLRVVGELGGRGAVRLDEPGARGCPGHPAGDVALLEGAYLVGGELGRLAVLHHVRTELQPAVVQAVGGRQAGPV